MLETRIFDLMLGTVGLVLWSLCMLWWDRPIGPLTLRTAFRHPIWWCMGCWLLVVLTLMARELGWP